MGAASQRIAVIGGGWAGLACAVTLSDAGRSVTVYEASDTLGGRARRVEQHGVPLDNGQHLLLGAYRQTLDLIRRVQPGVAPESLYSRTALCIAGPEGFRLRAARLPAPWHTLIGLVLARDCTWAERSKVIRAFARWRRTGWRCDPAMAVDTLLADQPPRMTARLWQPICLAALNTPPASASAQVFLNVLRDGLAGSRTDSDLIIPVVDLSRLFPDPAAAYVRSRGGTLRTHAMVERIETRDNRVDVRLRNAASEAAPFDRVVIATAPWQASRLLDPLPAAKPAQRLIDAYEYLPICTVNLRLSERADFEEPMLQLPGDGPGQWVFDRTPAGMQGSLVTVVISADGPHRRLPHDRLAADVFRQLRRALPSLQAREPVWSHVITEKRATFACTALRAHPAAGSVAPRVYLAGDHTDPDYPATLEAATRSGVRAARAVLGDTS